MQLYLQALMIPIALYIVVILLFNYVLLLPFKRFGIYDYGNTILKLIVFKPFL